MTVTALLLTAALAHQARAQYSVAALGVDACPGGTHVITGAPACAAAASALGYTYDATYETMNCNHATNCGARVCHVAGNAGGVARLFDGHGNAAEWICKEVTLPPTTPPTAFPTLAGGYMVNSPGVDACPAGLEAITDGLLCSQITTAMGYTYDASYESNTATSGGGLGDRVCHYSPFIGAARLFNNHGVNAQWICKPVVPTSPPPTPSPVPAPTPAPVVTVGMPCKDIGKSLHQAGQLTQQQILTECQNAGYCKARWKNRVQKAKCKRKKCKKCKSDIVCCTRNPEGCIFDPINMKCNNA